jgi:hypothetical protein
MQFDARAGRLFLSDRKDTGSGFETVKVDITNKQVPFAIDFLSCEVGWAKFTAGAAPVWHLVPLGQPLPPRPADKYIDKASGREKPAFSQCFRTKVGGKDIGGIRELAGSARVFLAGIDELHTKYEAAPEAQSGKIPVVKLVDSKPVTSGNGAQSSTNYQPVFEIVAWVDRPEKLGAATVAVPKGAAVQFAPEKAPAPAAAPAAREMEDAIPF